MITVWNSLPSLDFPITPINGYFDLLMAERENHSNSDCRFCILRRRAGLKNYALRERLFQVWNHKSSGVELWSRSWQNTKFAAWVFALLRVSMRDDKRKMGPSFTGHQCAWLEGLWGQAVQQLKHHQGSCTHTQVRVSALDLSARLLLYPVWVGALEPLVVYR